MRWKRVAAAVLGAAVLFGVAHRSGESEAANEFVGSVPQTGIGLGIWSGGDVSGIASSVAGAGCSLRSVWTAAVGELVPFIPGSPEVVNERFLAAFGGSVIPASTPLIIVCGSPPAPPATAPPPSNATPAPTSALPPPSGAFTFGDGVLQVGSQVPPGRYRAAALGSLCYWARLSGFGGSLDEIIANGLPEGSAVVDIKPGDAGFESNGCGTWTNDLHPITASTTAPFGDGTFIVGTDIAAGTWSTAGGANCYWARLSGFGGTLNEIIANALPPAAAVVAIAPGDAGFETSGCGSWTKS